VTHHPSTLSARMTAAFVLVALAGIGIFALLTLARIATDLGAASRHQQSVDVAAISAALRQAYGEDHRWTAADLAPAIALARAEGVDLALRIASPSMLSVTGTTANGPDTVFDVVIDGKPVAHVALQVRPGSTATYATLRRAITRSVALAGLLSAIVAVLCAVLLARRLTRPLERLRAAAARLGAGAKHTRVEGIKGPAEVTELASAFNSMAADLEREDELRRNLTANVAHELRTPLTILRTQTAALADGVSDWSPAVACSIDEEAMRLSRLVEDLGTMASADAASLTIESAPVRLDRVVGDELRRLHHRFEAKGMHVHAGLRPSWVIGDWARLGQVAGNLLVNAARYGRPAGAVTVEVAPHSSVVTLTVSDDGPGIPEEERDQIFGQFARGSTAKGVEGSGIGLAVVRELVAAHSGKISVGRSIQGGAEFTVTFPKAPAEPEPELDLHRNHTQSRLGSHSPGV
jgi:two-component system sensor histidine kinase BaeS